MAKEQEFNGFPKKAIKFLKDLKKNNDKDWFAKNKGIYDENIMVPSKAFVVAMGQRLTEISSGIMAEPKVNGSIFRINRDTRFAKDKSPYKTNIGIFFWEGAGKRMECPGFYFHLEPTSLMLGTGLYMFPKHLIEPYREAVADKKLGPQLTKAMNKVGPEAFGHTGCGMPIDAYKKVPKGYDPNHPRAELLKFKGMHAGWETKIPKELHSAELIEYCFTRFKDLAPLHRWLVKMLATAS